MSDLHIQSENESSEMHVPLSGVVYGNIIYWGTILGTVVSIIGSIITFTTDLNLVDPINELSAVWQGKSVDEIWISAGTTAPNHHWYLSLYATGNGLTMGGIAIAVFSVTIGIIGAAVVLLREKNILFAWLAIISAIITVFAMV